MGNLWSVVKPGVWGDGQRVSGYIYRIQGASGKTYIGSTTEKDLNRRLRVHEASFRLWQRRRGGYCSVFEILEGGDYDIKLLETVKSGDRKALRVREGYYYCIFGDSVVNLRNPYRQPWDHKRQRAKAMRGHYARNSGLINERNKERNSQRVKCEVCGVWISRGYRASHERTNKHFNNTLLKQMT